MSIKKTYLDVYPHCEGCPVQEYCGTMVSTFNMCNSYPDKDELHSDK